MQEAAHLTLTLTGQGEEIKGVKMQHRGKTLASLANQGTRVKILNRRKGWDGPRQARQ